MAVGQGGASTGAPGEAHSDAAHDQQLFPAWAAVLAGTVASAAAFTLGNRFRLARLAAQAARERERHRCEVLGLYQRIMRVAQRWPSMKRHAVITEIRHEFRANAAEKDKEKIETMLSEARRGYKELLHDVTERARLRFTPSTSRGASFGAWPGEGRDGAMAQQGAEQWALDELGVGTSPTMSEAKAAYHERAKACHPDSGNSSADAEAFKKLKMAWEHVQMHLRRDMLRGQQGSRFR